MTFAALALVAAACGDSDDSGSGGGGALNAQEQEALDAIEELSSTDDSPFDDLSEDELRCAARGVVSDDGLFSAMTSDADFEELSPDQQLAAMNLFVDCAPETLSQVIADSMAEGTGLSGDDAKCIAEEILNDQAMLSGFLAAGAAGGEPGADLIAGLFDMLETCNIPLSALSG